MWRRAVRAGALAPIALGDDERRQFLSAGVDRQVPAPVLGKPANRLLGA